MSDKEYLISKEKAMEDLKVIKRMIEETRKGILPGMTILIFWGIWVLVGNSFTQVMTWLDLKQYIGFGWMTLIVVAVVFNGVFWKKVSRAIKGMHPYLSRQIGAIWWTLIGMCGILQALGFPLGIFTAPLQSGIMWTTFISIGLCITGIIYSKEFFFAGLFCFLGIFVAAILKAYAWLILGIFVCLADIGAVVLAKRRFKKLEINE